MEYLKHYELGVNTSTKRMFCIARNVAFCVSLLASWHACGTDALIGNASARTSVSVPASERVKLFDEYFAKHWSALKQRLTVLAASENPTRFYDLQLDSNLLLDRAIDRGRKDLIVEILELYSIPFKRLEQHQEYAFYGGEEGNQTRIAVLKTSRPYKAWLMPRRDGHREESILHIAQFLYAVTRGLNAVDQTNQVLSSYGPILRDHYTRWILGIENNREKGPFQRLAWDCGRGRFNHDQFVLMLSRKAFKSKPSFCNVITDVELWVIGGAVELVALDATFPAQVGLTPSERQALKEYIARGTALLRARMIRTSVNVEGALEQGLLFDPGSWRDYPAMKYAGVTDDAFPSLDQAPRETVPNDIAMDVSHARRLVQVMETLYRNRKITGSDFPTESDMRALTNQLSFGLFDGNYRFPRFKNYINGSNGWFRVGDSKRRGFGYHPYSMSIEWLSGGYCRLEKYQPKMRSICDSLVNLVLAKENDAVAYREGQFGKCFYSNFVKQSCGELSFSRPSFYLLNFLASLRE